MNYSLDEASLGRDWYRRRVKAFLALTIVFLVLTVFGIATVATNQEDKGTLIAGTVQFGVLTMIFAALSIKMRHDEKNPASIRSRGALIATTLAMSLPDFKPTNEFVVCPREKRSPKVWVSQESEQIQFLLPCQNVQKKRREALKKTKAMEVSALLNVHLNVSTQTVMHYGGYATNPMEKRALIAVGGMKTEKTIGYYSVDFFFDDVDLPFVRLNFGRDGEGAKRLYHAMKALMAKHEQ